MEIKVADLERTKVHITVTHGDRTYWHLECYRAYMGARRAIKDLMPPVHMKMVGQCGVCGNEIYTDHSYKLESEGHFVHLKCYSGKSD